MVFYYCIHAFQSHCRSFNPSQCRLSPYLPSYVAVSRPRHLSEFYPNKASVNSQLVCLQRIGICNDNTLHVFINALSPFVIKCLPLIITWYMVINPEACRKKHLQLYNQLSLRKTPLGPRLCAVILLQILMVSSGTHLVKNHEFQCITNEYQLENNESDIENASKGLYLTRQLI